MRSFYLRLIKHGPENLPGWLLYLALWPLGCLYGLVSLLRRQAYIVGLLPVYRASVPVISVGNITAGGTGKTPLVDSLVKDLLSKNRKVAVVSRGYKGTFSGDWCRIKPEMESSVTGDEPCLLAARNPGAYVYVARKRRLGVMAAEKDGVDCVILDDGFQHFAVQRDLDMVLLDERNPFGNGAVMPAGYLREPKSALHRADVLVQTHSQFTDELLVPGFAAVKCRHQFADHLIDQQGGKVSWEELQGKSCLAFAGIAHPDDFFTQLKKSGCALHDSISLSDHQEYTSGVVQQINQASDSADYLLTTEKDFVKLQGADFVKPCLAVPLQLEFDNFAVIEQSLAKLVGGCHG